MHNIYNGSFHDMMDGLINSTFGDILSTGFTTRQPAVNIVNTDSGYTIQVAAPGLKKEDFSLEVKDNKLTISADTSTAADEKTFLRKEYSFGKFSRTFRLSKEVDTTSVTARYEDGMLSIDMGKRSKEDLDQKIDISIS